MAKKKSKKDKTDAKKDKKRAVKKPGSKAKKKAAKPAPASKKKAAKSTTKKRKPAGKNKPAAATAKKLPRREPSDDEISEKAYELFRVREAAGEHGDPLDDWEKARQILRGDWTR